MVTALALSAAWAQNRLDPGPGRFGGRIIGGLAGMPGRVVKNAPYSADLVTESTQTLADGSHIRQTTTSHLYRDSEGRTRREQSLGALGIGRRGGMAAAAPGAQIVFINDPVAGVNYALNPADKTANKSSWTRQPGRNAPMPGGPRAREGFARQHAADGNVKTEQLGTQTIDGVQAQGTRTTLAIPANSIGNETAIQVVSERWYSPDLQMVVLEKRSDPRNGDTVTRLTNINRAEPAAALFQAPADYKVTEMARPMRGQPPANEQ